jgi:uncharacterized protein YqgC (DUF456 family)
MEATLLSGAAFYHSLECGHERSEATTNVELIVVDVVVGLLFVAGLVGAVLPFVPGPLLILVGAFIYAAATRFAVIGTGRLTLLAALTALGYLLAHCAGALGASRHGGSRWAVLGAIVGGLFGMLLGPFGLILGPAIGAIVFELLASGNVDRSVRSGLGALLGLMVGAVAHLSLAVMMIGLFLWWLCRG